MSATRPVPKITGAPGTAYPYTGGPIAPLTLSAATSEPSDGAASVTAYLWTLVYRPPGSSAVITNPTSVECLLEDALVPGTHLVHLKVTDSSGRVSFDKWYPKQDPTTKLIEGPETTAMVEVVLETENLGLELPGDYSRRYTEKLNDALRALDQMKADFEALRTGFDFTSLLTGPQRSIVTETPLGIVPAVYPLTTLDSLEFKSRIASTVDTGDGGEVQLRVAKVGDSIVLSGTTLMAFNLSTGFARVSCGIDVLQDGISGSIAWTAEVTTSAGWPAGQINENGSGVALDLSSGLQIGLVAVNVGTFGSSSSIEATLMGVRRT